MPWWVGLLIGLFCGAIGGVILCIIAVVKLSKAERLANRK